MNSLFKDNELDKIFKEDGFVIIPFVEPSELTELKKVFDSFCSYSTRSTSRFYYSILDNDFKQNTGINREIKGILNRAYQNTFQNYRAIANCFLAKPCTTEPIMLHQDWNYLDENKFSTATVWCPLRYITEDNGALFAIRGSHLFYKNLRSGSLSTSRVSVRGLEKYIVPIQVKEGESVIFHPALMHGSFPNQTNMLRVIACSLIIEDSASIIYYHNRNGQEADIYSINEDTMFQEMASLSSGALPMNGTFVKTVPYRAKEVTSLDLLAKAERAFPLSKRDKFEIN